MKKQLPDHRTHHYPTLIRRWRQGARQAGLKIIRYGEQDGFPLYALQSGRPPPDSPKIYLSAGIHGDEPAGPEGLLSWVLKHPETLKKADFLIFPCLNPWGLTWNIRTDASGIDLNRQFHDLQRPALRALHQLIAGKHFDLALALHEDYDGQGIYIYELNAGAEPWSPDLLEAAAAVLPHDPRRTIDGRRFTQPGYLHRDVKTRRFPDGPETIFLAKGNADACFTIETPSEFSLDRRIRAHRIIIQAAIKRLLRVKADQLSFV